MSLLNSLLSFFFSFPSRLRCFLVSFYCDPFDIKRVHYWWEIFLMFQRGRIQSISHIKTKKVWAWETCVQSWRIQGPFCRSPPALRIRGQLWVLFLVLPLDFVTLGKLFQHPVPIDFVTFGGTLLTHFCLLPLCQAFKPASSTKWGFLSLLWRAWLSGSLKPKFRLDI